MAAFPLLRFLLFLPPIFFLPLPSHILPLLALLRFPPLFRTICIAWSLALVLRLLFLVFGSPHVSPFFIVSDPYLLYDIGFPSFVRSYFMVRVFLSPSHFAGAESLLLGVWFLLFGLDPPVLNLV